MGVGVRGNWIVGQWIGVILLGFGWIGLLTGCGNSEGHVPVTGTLLMDGKPMQGAGILLVPQPSQGLLPAEGVTDASGKFKLSTTVAPGAKPGDYRVSVTLVITSGVAEQPGGVSGTVAPGGLQQTWVIPQNYSSPDTSGLTVTVKSGMPPIAWDLKSQQ